MTITRKEIREALVRGYSADANAMVILDPVLIDAMADEVMTVIERAIVERETYKAPP